MVLVTVLDPSAYGKAHSDSVRENRAQYAARHGETARALSNAMAIRADTLAQGMSR